MELLRRLSLTIFLMTLVACGGGSLDGGTDPDPDPVPTPDVITVTITKSGDVVSAAAPATITATILKNGEAIAGETVTFTLDKNDSATFSPLNGIAFTNESGIATIGLLVGGTSGDVVIKAIIDSGEQAVISINSLGDGNTVGEGPNVANISLFADSQQLASSGGQEITLTAITKDINNNLIEGAIVSFSVDSGQIQVIKSKTGPDGKATAILKTSNEPSNRVLTVISTSSAVTDTVSVQVVGTTVSLTGSSSLALNDENTYIIKVLDSDGTGIANQIVALSSTNISTAVPVGPVANITLPETITTDFTGQASIKVKGTSGGTNTLVASTLGATSKSNVSVQSDSFLFTGFNNGVLNTDPSNTPLLPDVLLSKSATVSLTWLRDGSNIANGKVVNFTSTRGTLSTNSATIVDGKVSVVITSVDAGKALITFTGTDEGIVLNNQLEFEFVAENISTIVAQASPKSIGPDGQTSTISIVVKDVAGNLVKNKTIDFTLTDTNGGTIFPASSVTDSNGSASTVYTSNAVSAQNGVSIKATDREQPSIFDTVMLTVADREVFIALGTGNSIIDLDETTYNKQYSVFVTDIDSNPIKDVELTVSAIPKTYYKGSWERIYEGSEFKTWKAVRVIVSSDPIPVRSLVEKFACLNEDINLNGILDAGEDTNGDGLLTPGNVVNIAGSTGSIVTDEQGRAILDILYAQSFGHWIDLDLIVSAKVNGTESYTIATFTLPVNANDLNDEDVTPPTSSIETIAPFGQAGSCTTSN